MKRPRTSIRAMMAVVLFVAIAIAALTQRTRQWSNLVHWLTISCLCLALVGTVFRVGAKRRFWASFAVFGWFNYMWAFILPLLYELFLPSRSPPTPPVEFFIELMLPSGTFGQLIFNEIAYSLWVIANGFLGGLVARYFFAKGGNDAAPPV